MTSWISWLAVGLIIAVLVYATMSVYLKRSLGLYIAAAFHIVLGIISLPSIGLYVLVLAIIELIIAIVMTMNISKKPN